MFDMQTTATKEALKAKAKAADDAAFRLHLASPEAKLIVSLIPASEPPEVVEIALRAAFDSGISHGTTQLLGVMLDSMLKQQRPKD